MRFFIFLVIFLISNIAFSQEVLWKANGLTWDDFKGESNKFVNYGFQLSYQLGFKEENTLINDINVRRLVAYTNMNPKLSWVKAEAKTPQNLRYNQLVLDIVEYNRRKLQYYINDMANFTNLQTTVDLQMKSVREMIDAMQKETNSGQNDSLTIAWKTQIDDAISRVAEKPVPLIKKGNSAFGMSCGFSANILSGNINQYFGSSGGLFYGLNFARKKSNIMASVYFSAKQPIKSTYINQEKGEVWEKNAKNNTTIFDLSYGHLVWENRKNKLIPFVGASFFEFSTPNSNMPKEDYLLQGFGYSVGLIHEYSYSKNVNLLSNLPFQAKRRELDEYGIKSKFSFFPIFINNELKGSAINLSVGINLNGYFVKINP